MLPNVHLGKDWQEKVKTWFNQPGRKRRRRVHRARRQKLLAPNPTHLLRPIVRGQTNKYNTKRRLGRGFTKKELESAGIKGLSYARSIGIAIDLRRKDTCSETLNVNTERIKNYISRIILYPRKKNDKKPQVKEATQEQLNTPEAKEQNKSKVVIEFPKEEPGYEFANVTKEMTDKNIYQLQRKEIKTAKGFYKRLEESKKKAAGKK
jgi:large subunit ribosomal protein L13e